MHTFAVAQLSTTGRVRFHIDRNDTRAFKDSHSFPRACSFITGMAFKFARRQGGNEKLE